jgi:hypothetical protein
VTDTTSQAPIPGGMTDQQLAAFGRILDDDNGMSRLEALRAAWAFVEREARASADTARMGGRDTFGDCALTSEARASAGPDAEPIIKHALEIAEDTIATKSKDIDDWIDDVGEIAMYLRAALTSSEARAAAPAPAEPKCPPKKPPLAAMSALDAIVGKPLDSMTAAAQAAAPAGRQELAERAIAALRELHATVRGECPSLLDEDSGGTARLALEIEDVLDRLAAQQEGGGNG